MDIKQLLARRSDLSTFLVHLTREYPPGTHARDNLKSILIDQVIEARTAYGSAVKRLDELEIFNDKSKDTQKVVCFTETPLEHVRLLTGEIEKRATQFGPYGIAISKRLARKTGVNPVWYLDITPGHSWLTTPLNNLINKEIEGNMFATSDIAKLAPFIEQMGVGENYFKEYWWEREWRHLGDFSLDMKFIVICPEKEWESITPDWMRVVPRPFVDPEWSLEKIIGRLAGFEPTEVDPF